MNHTSNPIVFFGTDTFSLTTLTGFLEAGLPVSLVVTKPDAPAGRGHKLTPPAVKRLAETYGVTVLQPNRLSEIVPAVEALGPSIGVLSSYGKIVPGRILNLFTPGVVNIHPSLLPYYRGPSPIETAIVNGDTRTGVSVMRLAPAMDAGPVYVSKEIILTGSETAPQLYTTLAEHGTELLLEALPAIISGKLQPTEQDQDHATYTTMLQKSDSWLDPTLFTAKEVERRVRAYLAFPRTKLTVYGQTVIVTKARVGYSEGQLSIPCKDGTHLTIEELVAPSGRRMSGLDFIRGYKKD